jgi:hypothetical protein
MSGRTFTVSNATELGRVARTAVGGDTILLASGSYGNVTLKNLNPNGVVTIKSANPDADAVFETLKFARVNNFTVEDVDVHHVLRPGERDFSPAIRIDNSANLTFVGLDVFGSLNNNPNDDGVGIWSQNSSRVAVLDSTFRELNNAAVFPYARGLVFAGNTISDVREGINISQVDDVLIERNFITRVMPNTARGDHADAIQLHAGGVFTTSSDIVIRSNVMLLGDSEAQGIFLTSQKASRGQLHSNITVQDNYYEGNSRHGITVTDTINVEISGNTIRDMGTRGLAPALNTGNIRGGLVEENIAPLLLPSRTAPSTDLVWRNNIDVWDRVQRAGVADSSLFDTPVGSRTLDFSTLNVRAGTTAANQNIGFEAVDHIGDIKTSTAAMIAAYMPMFDNITAHTALV